MPIAHARLVARRGVVGLAALATAACLVGMVAYRVTYGTFAFWADPTRISWCGRDYLPGQHGLLSYAEVEQRRAALSGDQPYPLAQVATVPPVVGDPVLASVTPQETRDRLRVPCAMVLYLQTGPDSYRPYELSGGP
jgi:hypothetical protein